MKLKCDNCGNSEEHENNDIAFQKGWDIIHLNGFTLTVCGTCPAAPTVFKKANENNSNSGPTSQD